MALSEEERRVLEEMERQLTGAHADVVTPTPRKADVTLVTLGVLVVVVGIGILLAGVVSQFPIIGVVGFGVMVAGTFMIFNRRGGARTTPARPARSTSKLAERWDRRLDGEI